MEKQKTIRYNDNNFNQLTEQFKTLSTFEVVAEWDKRAQVEVERIIKVIQQLETEITQQSEALEQAKREHYQKPFHKRIFSGRKVEKDTAKHIEQCQQNKAILEEMADLLQEAVDFTPNSPEDKKVLIKELRIEKKELQAEKRAISSQMTAIRTEARQKSARVTNYGIRSLSKLATADRRSIRLAKERELAPHEDIKASIERQLIEIDKKILQAERIS